MKAVILVAGFGSRLRPLTDKSPKSLLPIGTSTTMERMVNALKERGVKEFIFVTGHFSEMIEEYVTENFEDCTVHFVRNDQYEVTNTGYSLLLAEPFVRGDSFIKFDGDVNFDPEILDLLLRQPDDANYICLDRTEYDDEVIKASINSDGVITALGKHVPLSDAVGESIGIEKISAQSSGALFDMLRKVASDKSNWQEYYEFSYDKLIKEHQVPFKFVDITGLQWVEMDTIEDYKTAQRYFG